MDVKTMIKMSVTAGMIAMLLAGCSLPVPREINPPRNAQYITVKGKVPLHTKPSIFAYYESPTCQFKTINMGSGARGKENYKLAKFAEIDFNEKTGEFSAKVPVDGGTRCHWSLKSFSTNVKYISTEHILKKNVSTLGNGVQVKISPNACNKENITYHQKIALYPQYYLLHYSGTGNDKEINTINLVNIKSTDNFGSYNDDYNLYISPGNTNEVIFAPAIDERYIVKQIDPNKGHQYLSVEYPDGSKIKGTNTIKPYPKDKRDQSLKEQKRLQESMGIFPIDTSKNPDACKNL